MLDGLLREIQGRVLMLIIIVYLKSLYKCISLLTSLHLISLHVVCTNVIMNLAMASLQLIP